MALLLAVRRCSDGDGARGGSVIDWGRRDASLAKRIRGAVAALGDRRRPGGGGVPPGRSGGGGRCTGAGRRRAHPGGCARAPGRRRTHGHPRRSCSPQRRWPWADGSQAGAAQQPLARAVRTRRAWGRPWALTIDALAHANSRQEAAADALPPRQHVDGNWPSTRRRACGVYGCQLNRLCRTRKSSRWYCLLNVQQLRAGWHAGLHARLPQRPWPLMGAGWRTSRYAAACAMLAGIPASGLLTPRTVLVLHSM